MNTRAEVEWRALRMYEILDEAKGPLTAREAGVLFLDRYGVYAATGPLVALVNRDRVEKIIMPTKELKITMIPGRFMHKGMTGNTPVIEQKNHYFIKGRLNLAVARLLRKERMGEARINVAKIVKNGGWK